VDLSSGYPALLRPGGVSREALQRVAGCPVSLRKPSPSRAGTVCSHYAPQAQVVLASPTNCLAGRGPGRKGLKVAVVSARRARLPGNVLQVPPPKSHVHFARGLYALLRRLDRQRVDAIVLSLPPTRGLGLAIADRLRRAAGRG